MKNEKEKALTPEEEISRKPEAEQAEEIFVETAPVGRSVRPEVVVEEPQDEPTASNPAARLSANERRQLAQERERDRQNWEERAAIIGKYIAAKKRNNVLRGVIAGVETKGSMACWAIYDGPVVVLIPFADALPYAPEEVLQSTPEAMARQRQMLGKSIGVSVPFSVEKMEYDEDSCYVLGSRRIAMERISARYFGANAPRPVKEGDTVIGRFVGIGPHAAWLEVCGIDVRLQTSQLTHRYTEDLNDWFKPGEEIRLVVKSLAFRDGKYRMRLSALPCELEECKPRLRNVRPRNRYVGTVTLQRIVEKKFEDTDKVKPYYVVSLWLDGINVPAFATVASAHIDGTTHFGDKVIVEVDDITANGYVRCRIINYL